MIHTLFATPAAAHDRVARGLASAWWALRVGLGVTAIVAGLDKFFGLLTDWGMYLAPWVEHLSPLSGTALLRVVGVVEIAAGLLVLSRLTRLGAYVVAGWLALVALQLVSTGAFLDLAARDVVLAIAAFALAKLSEWRSAVPDTI